MWNLIISQTISVLLIFSEATGSCSASSLYDDLHNSQERIVSDLETIESANGVPVDFSYNETVTESEYLSSAPGCPKSIDGYPWIYYGNPPRCYLAGYTGPCGFRRYLLIEHGSTFGVCGCDCFKDLLEQGLSDVIETSQNGRYKFCGSSLGYDSQQKICYDLEERGFCGPGQWLVRSNSDSLICIEECPTINENRQIYDRFTGKCEKNFGGAGAGGGSSSFVVPNRCIDTERYSSILKKCVSKKAGTTLVLG